jgi:DNA repair exonuclease SbcCD nuclease subunit
MSKIRMLHCGDTHLRAAQYHHRSRAEDFENALNQSVDLALRHSCGLIVHTGDFYDSPAPPSRAVAFMLRLHRRLVDAGIPMLCIQGNHDWSEPSWTSIVSDGTGSDRRSGIIPMEAGETYEHEGVRIVALPWCGPEEFRASMEVIPSGDVLLWHGIVREFVDFPCLSAVSLADIPLGKWKAVMLGDIHKPEIKYLADGAPVAYPGSTEICAYGEPMEKTMYVWTVEPGKIPDDPFAVKLVTRPAAEYEVDDDVKLAEALAALRGQDRERLLCYLNYTAAVAHAPSSFRAALGAGAILRPMLRFLDEDTGQPVFEDDAGDIQPVLPMQSYVDKILSREDELFDLVFALADPDNNPGFILDSMLDQKLKVA